MNQGAAGNSCSIQGNSTCLFDMPQKILVFQQHGSAESKISGIEKYGEKGFILEVISIDVALPAVVDHSTEFLPGQFQAALVLDFLKHPDLSQDLALHCSRQGIPVVASGKKMRIQGVFTPPT